MFHDDGSLDTGDHISDNDDPEHEESWVDGKGDGSISSLDSFLSENLAEGDYVLAIGGYDLGLDDAISQTSLGRGLFTNEMPYPSQKKYSDHGDWRLTITGDVTIIDVQTGGGAGEPIPEPGTLALLGLGAAAAGLAKRRRQKRAAA